MGQNQPRIGDSGEGKDGIGSAHNRNDLKDRAKVGNFQPKTAVNSATGQGEKENPGKPT